MKIIFENEKGNTEGFEVPLDKWFKIYRTVREILEADG